MPSIFSLPRLTRSPEDGPGPSPDPDGSNPEETSAPIEPVHQNPFTIFELKTEEDRSRQREAAWISLIVHLVVIVLLLMLPKILPQRQANRPLTAAELMKQKDLTFLELPPSPKLTPTKPPDAISDQDRVASARRPTIDRKTLD